MTEQTICFICKVPISNLKKSATCEKTKCQYEYDIQHDTWKKVQMDYLYGIIYETKGDEE
jgi:hypothetical protein